MKSQGVYLTSGGSHSRRRSGRRTSGGRGSCHDTDTTTTRGETRGSPTNKWARWVIWLSTPNVSGVLWLPSLPDLSSSLNESRVKWPKTQGTESTSLLKYRPELTHKYCAVRDTIHEMASWRKSQVLGHSTHDDRYKTSTTLTPNLIHWTLNVSLW